MPYEEFDVNFLDMQYLAKDLNKISPYSFPIVIFNFQQVNGLAFGQSQQNGFVDRKGMYLTTKELFDRLENGNF